MPGPVPYTDKGGGGPLPPHGEDFFNRIVNVHWPKRLIRAIDDPEQALVVIDFNTGTAVALDSGQSFSGVVSGASGRLQLDSKSTRFTVLTDGLVVYGKPAGGDACFIASINGTTILRGSHSPLLGETSSISWDTVHSVAGGSTCGLSFSDGVFFVLTQAADGSIQCAASTDGIQFAGGGNPFSGVPEDEVTRGRQSGSIAGNGKGSFVATGEVDCRPNYFVDKNVIVPGDDAMMWATSSDGTSWSSDYSKSELINPGQLVALTRFGFGSFDACGAKATVAGGNGLFVSVATQRTNFFWFHVEGDDVTNDNYTTRPTAAAAISNNGGSWSTVPLPGAIEAAFSGGGTVNSQSQSNAVAFIKTGETASGIAGVPPIPAGYFVMTANGSHADNVLVGGCWRGEGGSWSQVMSGEAPFGHVSAIAKNLDQTTIVRV